MLSLDGISAVLFDLDGTIADTNEVILRTITETLEYTSGRRWQRAELLPYWGLRLREQLVTLYPVIDLEQAVPFYRARYAEYHASMLAEFPGMRAMLAQLQTGYQLAVVTSKKRDGAWLTLEGIGYAEFFPLLIVEEDTARHKPAPAPLLLALERLQVSAAEAIYVGDNPDDIIAAHAAGMRAVAVGWSLRTRAELLAAQPDALIETPDDLLALLASAPVIV